MVQKMVMVMTMTMMAGSEHYWKKGWLGCFLDANETIENIGMPEEETETLKDAILRSRKE